MILVVSYDVSDDRRRNRLHKTLLDFGTPVQFSVFECDVRGREESRIKAAVAGVVKRGDDRVRFYRLCGRCRERIDGFPALPPGDTTGILHA